MTKYDIIYESLQEQVNTGVLALEDAELINDLAYNKYVVEKMTPRERYLKKQYIKHENQKDTERKSKNYEQREEINVSDKDAETLHKSHDYLMKLANNHDRKSDDKIALANKALKKKLKIKDDEVYGYSTNKHDGKVDNTVGVSHQYGYGKSKREKFDNLVKSGEYDNTSKKKINALRKTMDQPKSIYHGSKTGATSQIRPSQYSISDSKFNSYYDDNTDSGRKFSRLYPKRRIYGMEDPNDINALAYGGFKNLHKIDPNGRKVHSDPLSKHYFIEYEDELEDIEKAYNNNKIDKKQAEHKMDSLYHKILKSGKKDTEKILRKVIHAKNKIFKK